MTHSAARKLFERHQPWALSVAGAALRRIGPQADGEEIRQVAQVTTWEKALRFDPKRFTVKPTGDPFQIYAYPSVYGACLMAGYRGASGRAKTRDGNWISVESIHVGWFGWYDGTKDASGVAFRSAKNAESSSGKSSNAIISVSRTFTEHSGLQVKPNQDAVDESLDRAARAQLIVSILHELPQRERFLISEHYLAGVSLSAIAESLFTSPSSVSRIHASALNLLRIAVARRGMKAGEWL